MEQLLPVQGQVDLVALAQTGTGKTAAFGLPLLEYFGKPTGRPQALILSPTRELCVQISVELEKYAAHLPAMRLLAVYGGSNIATQIKALKQGVDIVIATPGRLMDLQRRGVLHLDQLTHVVLDEADEMLNMGFVDDIREVLSLTPPEVHVWLFSATMPDAVARISEEFKLTTARTLCRARTSTWACVVCWILLRECLAWCSATPSWTLKKLQRSCWRTATPRLPCTEIFPSSSAIW
jgi:ATP-dependent RNA helicase DeaD